MDRASFAYQNVFSITITVKIEQEWLSEGFNVITGEGGQKLKEAVKEFVVAWGHSLPASKVLENI